MSNVDQSFDPIKLTGELSKAAPILLILCALCSFFFVGFFSVHYYEKIFSSIGSYARTMAVVIAVITELVRFALLLASVRDFADKKPFNGWLGLFGSVALVFHEIDVARSIAEMLNPENVLALSGILIFAVLVGFGLEVRLVMTMGKTQKSSENIFRKTQKSSGKKSERSNGVYTVNDQ